MQFQSSFITQAGSNLFASATSSTNGDPSTPIVWMYARTYNLDTSGYSPDAMRALDVSALTNGSGNKQTSIGNVTSAVQSTATDSSSGTPIQIPAVRLTCELSNTNTYYGLARNLAVFAKLKGQPDTSVVLAAIARVDTGHHVDEIPSKSNADFSATIDFVLAIKDSQINTIQAPASYYASAQTVQALADRVVTTHVANSNTTGESQDIYGIKTFKNNTKHTGDVLPTINNTYSLGNAMLGWKNIYAAGNNNHYICIGYDGSLSTNSKLSISPDQNSFGQLGTSNKRWSKIYAESYYVGNTELRSYIASTTVTNATTATNLTSNPSLTWSDASSSAAATLSVTAGGKTSTSVNVEKVRYAYNLRYSTTNVLSATSTTQVTSYGNIIPNGTRSLGSSSSKWNYLYCNYIGNSSNYITSAYITTMNGTATNAVNATKIYVNTTSDDKLYPLVFRENFDTPDVNLSSGNKTIYSDSKNNCYYNPSTNTLTVKNIELGESGIINLASYFGINLQIIDIYCSGVVNPGNSLTFASGNTVKTGTGGYGHGGSSNHSNYTVCVHGSNNILYSNTYKITKMISAGQNSYNQTQNYNGVEIAKPGYGTPCICFAIIVS